MHLNDAQKPMEECNLSSQTRFLIDMKQTFNNFSRVNIMEFIFLTVYINWK